MLVVQKRYASMQETCEPCAGNDYLGEHAELILSSYFRMTGRNLIDPELSIDERYRVLFNAPFCVVSHNTETDPIFNYGNKVALALFEIQWNNFINLPSRLSAEPQTREEREQLLERVTQYGFIEDYKGVRISSLGKRFFVDDAIVWNMADKQGRYCGQAAVLFKWSKL